MYTEMFGMFFNSLLYTDQVLWELCCIFADGAYLGISNAVRNSLWKSQSLHKFNSGLFLKPHERHNIEICEIYIVWKSFCSKPQKTLKEYTWICFSERHWFGLKFLSRLHCNDQINSFYQTIFECTSPANEKSKKKKKLNVSYLITVSHLFLMSSIARF